MSRLLDACETTVSPSYRLFGLVDTSVDTCTPDADRSHWLLPAPGMVYLQVPSEVINASVRLESWSTAPPVPSARWSGREEVAVKLPEGELGLATIDDGVEEIPLVLPSPGTYKMRWQWVFNPESGPFTFPLEGPRDPLETPTGHEAELNGKEQFCLVQMWRVTAGTETA
ncbi:hypothetical protein AB0P36_32995 [Streptomyces flavidovirens]|uniref:hypothetical protein n=1 Tax=Streptomyces flavidovirens TaxID=67298 RepID=UPI003438D49D